MGLKYRNMNFNEEKGIKRNYGKSSIVYERKLKRKHRSKKAVLQGDVIKVENEKVDMDKRKKRNTEETAL